jgi:A/G-specific adenine glycosylase
MAIKNVKNIQKILIRVGRVYGNKYAWHKTSDPFKIFIAEFFLCRTTRIVVEKLYPTLLTNIRNPDDLLKTSKAKFLRLTKVAGLRKRSLALFDVAKIINRNGGITPNKIFLLSLPYVGNYVADAVLLYAFKRKVFPLDKNVQRVIYRFILGEEIIPKIAPYRDDLIILTIKLLIKDLTSSTIRNIHQAILYIAWSSCKAQPQCGSCQINRLCRYYYDK